MRLRPWIQAASLLGLLAWLIYAWSERLSAPDAHPGIPAQEHLVADSGRKIYHIRWGDVPPPQPAEFALPQVDPNAVPDSQWIEGVVLFPEGSQASPSTRVWSKGGLWDGVSPWMSAPVEDDGRFRIAVAPGTEVAQLGLQDPKHGCGVYEYRAWHDFPLVLHAQPQVPHEIRFAPATSTGKPWAQPWHLFWQGSQAGRPIGMPLVPRPDGVCAFALPAEPEGRLYLMGSPHPVAPLAFPGEGKPSTLVWQVPPASTLRGRITSTGSEPLAFPWLLVASQPQNDSPGNASVSAPHNPGAPVPKKSYPQKSYPQQSNPQQSNKVGSWSWTAQGHPGGSFSIQVPSGAPLSLRLAARGHQPQTLSIPTVEPGEIVEMPPISLDPKASVRGQIVDGYGTPLPRIFLRASRSPNRTMVSPNDLANRADHATWTDAEGRFALQESNGSWAGYLIRFPESAPAIDPNHSGPLTIPEGTAIQEETWRADPGPVARGPVRFDPPAGGLTVRLQLAETQAPKECEILAVPHDESLGRCVLVTEPASPYRHPIQGADRSEQGLVWDPALRFVRPIEDGLVRFDELPPGPWDITLRVEGHAQVRWEHLTLPLEEPVQASLPLGASWRITARNHLGEPIPHAPVSLEGPLDPDPEGYPSGSKVYGEARTNAQGEWTWNHLPAGLYIARRSRVPGLGDAATVAILEPGERHASALATNLSGSLEVLPPWPGAAMSCKIYRTSGSSSPPIRIAAFGQVREDGTLLFPDLPPGNYEGLPIDPAWIGSQESPYERVSIAVRAGQKTTVRARLRPGFRKVVGRLEGD